MSTKSPKIHIQEPIHKRYSLCGKLWSHVSGGRAASTTEPPAVFNDESGSVSVATCRTCLKAFARSLMPRLPKG
jgi:hypothetical protein